MHGLRCIDLASYNRFDVLLAVELAMDTNERQIALAVHRAGGYNR